MRIRTETSTVVFNVIGYAVISILSFLCLFPFLLIISGSVTPENEIIAEGFKLVPNAFTFDAYRAAFSDSGQIAQAYQVTVLLTAGGTLFGLFLTAMAGYVLSRKDFRFRNGLSFFIYFTTLFSGGLVPFYLLITQYLSLKDNYLAVLLPGLMSPFLIIMMKAFVRSIPHAITESAKIDGAGDFTIFAKLILPMTTPALATIGLFIALGYWNEWYHSMLFMSADMKYRPLQLFLYNTITSADFIRNSAAASNVDLRDVPLESMKMATAVVATGPVILFYPFVQRYFIKGITVGAVKG